MAVSERSTYFTRETYQQIFSDPNQNSKGNSKILLGVSKNLFYIIGVINQYAFESRNALRNYYERKSPASAKSAQLPAEFPYHTAILSFN